MRPHVVQFYLLTICFALVATTWTSSRYLVRPAIDQLQQIEKVLDEWPVDSLVADAKKHYEEHKPPSLEKLSIPKHDSRPSIRVRHPSLYESITTKSTDDEYFTSSVKFAQFNVWGAASLKKPTNLLEFHNFWNHLNKPIQFIQLQTLSDRAYVSRNENNRPAAKSELAKLIATNDNSIPYSIVLDCDLARGTDALRTSMGIPESEKTSLLSCWL